MLPNLRVNSQRGSMLVTAIFVIVIMAILGLALTQIISVSSNAVVYEVQGLRTENASQSLLDEAIASVAPLAGAPSCVASQTVSNISSLDNCSVRITCRAVTSADIDFTYYRLSSEATCMVGKVVTSRTLAVDVKVDE